MPIVPSRTRDIQELIGRLRSESAAERDAAAARLRLLGERAVGALLEVLRRPHRGARLAALAALEGLVPGRSLPDVLRLVEDNDAEVARRAIETASASPEPRVAEALGRALASDRAGVRRAALEALGRLLSAGVTEALDPLLALLIAEDRHESDRVAALTVIATLPEREQRPLLRRLRGTRSAALRRARPRSKHGAAASRPLPRHRPTPRASVAGSSRATTRWSCADC